MALACVSSDPQKRAEAELAEGSWRTVMPLKIIKTKTGRRRMVRRPALAHFLAALMGVALILPNYALAAEPEFGGYCAEGLVNHKRIKTDCKITWTSKEGKLYCFADDAGKTAFLKAPEENIALATDNYAANDIAEIGAQMDKFTSDDAQTYVDGVIKAAAAKNSGVFIINDPVTETTIPLVYDKVDFTRTLDGYGFFPDVIFHAKDDPNKEYIVDFWVAPKEGKLSVLETRI